MADTVQYHLERMLPELDDLEKRGLFTRSEIKEIVKRRRDFEYLLKRHSALKQDYIRYVEYENKLEALRRLRKKGLARDSKGKKWTHSLSDKASSMRIMLIYERALTRFKGDLNLWLQYLEYCATQAPRKMQKVATKCLQLHPKVPGLWMYTAAWEFERNLNVQAARALMQRGLRICPEAETLWLEYFRMELTYMQKLKARRLALGLDPLGSSQRKKSSQNGSSQTELDVSSKPDEEEAADVDKVSPEDNLSYKLAQSVYANAIASVPSSLGFRQRFLEALDAFEFVKKNELEKEIQASIASDFPTDESSWDWLARRHVTSETRAREVFEEALEALPSAQMYELYAKLLTEILDAEIVGVDLGPGLHQPADKTSSHRQDVADSLCQLYERTLEGGIYSETLAKGHIEICLRSGRFDEALDLARKFCSMIQLRSSAGLWELRISLEIKTSSSPGTDHQDRESADKRALVLQLFQESMKTVALSEAQTLWDLVLHYYNGLESYVQIIVGMLEKVLSGGSGGRVGADLACTCLRWILRSQGSEQARQAYLRFLVLPGPSLEFFKLCISIEDGHEGAGCAESLQYSRKLFNDAVERFGQHDTDLWIDYYKMEMKAANVNAANNVYWRAKKILKDPTSFIERHQLF